MAPVNIAVMPSFSADRHGGGADKYVYAEPGKCSGHGEKRTRGWKPWKRGETPEKGGIRSEEAKQPTWGRENAHGGQYKVA